MRKLISSLVTAFVLLVGVTPIQAQVGLLGGRWPSSWEGWRYYLQGDQVHMVQADQINYVAETLNIGRRAQMLYVADDLMYRNGYFGLNTPNGFYPLYQCGKGQRIGRYAADIGIGTLLGAVLGGKKGAAIGGGLGAAVAVREDLKCWAVQNQMVVIDDPSDLASGNGGVVPMQGPVPMSQAPSNRLNNGWNPILRDQANSGGLLFGSYRGCLEQGLATLKNDGREAVRVYKNGSGYVDLLPRQSKCGDPNASYEAEVLTMVVDGYVGTMDTARTKPEGRPGLTLVWRY